MAITAVTQPEAAADDRPVVSTVTGLDQYRLFFVNAVDRFEGYDIYATHSEDDALNRARSLLLHHPYAAAIEVWKRGRRVGRVARD